MEIKKNNLCTKLSMRNGGCENRLCARAARARPGSCRIWYRSIEIYEGIYHFLWVQIVSLVLELQHWKKKTNLFIHFIPIC